MDRSKMKKILEYSEFVSRESIKDKLMALEKKWVDFQDEIYAISINVNDCREWLLGKYGELAREIGRLLPLDSYDTKEIEKELEEAALSHDLGYIVHYLLTYHLSGFITYPNYTDITPIKWKEVK